MKKAKIILALLVVFAVCFGLVACKKTEYTLNKTTLTLEEGQTQQLTVSSTADDEFSVEYTTSNAAVATVSASGLVTAVKAGTATITATVDGKELTCNVTVTATQPVVYEYALSATEITISIGGYRDISVNVTPNKTISVTYTSANPAIATVNANGRVTAVAVGETTIKAAVDGRELTCAVTVEKAPPTYTLTAVGSTLTEGNKTLVLVGETQKFVVTSSDVEDEFTPVWSSSNDDIATVAQDGTVTAVTEGDVTITAKIGNVTKTVAVLVFTYHYNYAETLNLAYDATDAVLTVSVDHNKSMDISYVLSDEDVVTIDDNGNITVVGIGEVTVTIKDGEATVGECVITVYPVVTASKTLQMHVGQEKEWTITANPADPNLSAEYAVVEGNDVVSIDNGTVTAIANGTAKITATIGDTVLTCDVIVNNLNASIEYKDIADDDREQLSGSNVAYWENYVNNDEINYKAIVSDEEDVIERIWGQGTLGYLSDFVYLIWTDGDSRCAKPSKPNGDFREGALSGVQGQDASVIPQITLNIKVYAGQTTIKLYAGAFKCHNIVTISNGSTVIASYDIQPNGEGQRKSLLTFSVDAKEAMTLTIVLTLSQPTADNSFITIGAVSVSGSTYQLEESSKRLAPEGTSAIVMKKDGEALTEGVTYKVIEGSEHISLNEETGVVTAISLGTAKIAVTADGRTRVYTVEVGYAYSLNADSVQLHEGQSHQIEVVSDPEGAEISATYRSLNELVATVSDSGLVTAVANGTVIIKVTVDGNDYELTVTVNDTNATSAITRLDTDKSNPIDITDGAEYWEQYIANGEVNHKHYVSEEEDIIDKTSTVNGGYLDDYAAWLTWTGGANSSNCSCGKCNKDAYTTPDGGWTDRGTKAMKIGQVNAVTALQFKLYAGQSVIKIYTGGYNLVGRVQLKLDGEVIAERSFDNRSAHISHLVTFTVDTVEACVVTAELVMLDNYGDSNNSCISLAAASVSGSVYQLAQAGERVAPNGQAQIVLNKDGVALTEGVQYEVVVEAGEEALATVDENGLVTAGTTKGTATIKVTADGRVRYFTLEIGYDYALENANAVTLKPHETHQISIVSTPAGSAATITYSSANPAIATVDEDGRITAVANGSTTITATVEGKEITVNVTVSGIEVSVETQSLIGGQDVINLSAKDVIYWEHYMNNEVNHNAGQDLIEKVGTTAYGYAGDYALIYYANGDIASGSAKSDFFASGYSVTHGDYRYAITLPAAGTYEIRVYTGAYNGTNLTSLLDGNDVLASGEQFSAGNSSVYKAIIFTVTVTESKEFGILIKNVDGDGKNNVVQCAAIAIADPSIVNNSVIVSKAEDIENESGKTFDLTTEGNLDWVSFGQTINEKQGGDLISHDLGSKSTGNDFRATIAYSDAEGDNASGSNTEFRWDNDDLSFTVKVNEQTKKLTLYVSGWQSHYCAVIIDSNGNILNQGTIANLGGTHAMELVFDLNFTAEETLTIRMHKLSGTNMGIAAVAVSGDVE